MHEDSFLITEMSWLEFGSEARRCEDDSGTSPPTFLQSET